MKKKNKVKRKITLAILSRKKNKSNMKILKHIKNIDLYCFAVISKPLKKGRIPKDNGGTKGDSLIVTNTDSTCFDFLPSNRSALRIRFEFLTSQEPIRPEPNSIKVSCCFNRMMMVIDGY